LPQNYLSVRSGASRNQQNETTDPSDAESRRLYRGMHCLCVLNEMLECKVSLDMLLADASNLRGRQMADFQGSGIQSEQRRQRN
jgi:hypothetical protein